VLIVDSQVHIGPTVGGDWTDPPANGASVDERIRRTTSHMLPSLADLENAMQRAAVSAAIIVPRTVSLKNGEDDPAIAEARRHPTRFALMVPVDPELPEQGTRLDQAASAPEVLGVRVSFHDAEPGTLQGSATTAADELLLGRTEWLWPALSGRDLPVAFNAPGRMNLIGAIADAHPSLRILVDHMSFGAVQQHRLFDDLRPYLGPVLGLARYPNVAVKASGLPGVVSEGYPFPLVQECLREVVGAFGAERVFWGSNYSRSPYPYERLVDFFIDELDFLSDDELAAIMGRGIARWLKWDSLEGIS
jgi:L-fuconolactonase